IEPAGRHGTDSLQPGCSVDGLLRDDVVADEHQPISPPGIDRQFVGGDLSIEIGIDGHIGRFAQDVDSRLNRRLRNENFWSLVLPAGQKRRGIPLALRDNCAAARAATPVGRGIICVSCYLPVASRGYSPLWRGVKPCRFWSLACS